MENTASAGVSWTDVEQFLQLVPNSTNSGELLERLRALINVVPQREASPAPQQVYDVKTSCEPGAPESPNLPTPKRKPNAPRKKWSKELHEHFVLAWDRLTAKGITPSPKKLMVQMREQGANLGDLTIRQTQSHHQKYKLKLQNVQDARRRPWLNVSSPAMGHSRNSSGGSESLRWSSNSLCASISADESDGFSGESDADESRSVSQWLPRSTSMMNVGPSRPSEWPRSELGRSLSMDGVPPLTSDASPGPAWPPHVISAMLSSQVAPVMVSQSMPSVGSNWLTMAAASGASVTDTVKAIFAMPHSAFDVSQHQQQRAAEPARVEPALAGRPSSAGSRRASLPPALDISGLSAWRTMQMQQQQSDGARPQQPDRYEGAPELPIRQLSIHDNHEVIDVSGPGQEFGAALPVNFDLGSNAGDVKVDFGAMLRQSGLALPSPLPLDDSSVGFVNVWSANDEFRASDDTFNWNMLQSADSSGALTSSGWNNLGLTVSGFSAMSPSGFPALSPSGLPTFSLDDFAQLSPKNSA